MGKGMDKADSMESDLYQKKKRDALNGPYVCPICEQDTLIAGSSTGKMQKVGHRIDNGAEYRYVISTRVYKYFCKHCGFKEVAVSEGVSEPAVDVYCRLYDKHRKDSEPMPSVGRSWP